MNIFNRTVDDKLIWYSLLYNYGILMRLGFEFFDLKMLKWRFWNKNQLIDKKADNIVFTD